MSESISTNKQTLVPIAKEKIDTSEWVDRYGDVLYRYALYRTSDKPAAEDLVQETFMAALKTISTFANKSSVQSWLLGILKHKVLDHYRHKMNNINSRIEYSDDIDSSFNEKGEWQKQLEQWPTQPDSEFSRKEFAHILRRCLSNLPSNQRCAFVLREIDGFDTEEICKDNDLTSTNLWVLLHRARKKLRDCLEANWFNTGVS
jgi:RNA polymerase sigma-70 factor (ECF subfamily)